MFESIIFRKALKKIASPKKLMSFPGRKNSPAEIFFFW